MATSGLLKAFRMANTMLLRWCAPFYDPEKRKLTSFLSLCKFLLDKSTLSERPKNKGHKLI
jgi:hypothetical protein